MQAWRDTAKEAALAFKELHSETLKPLAHEYYQSAATTVNAYFEDGEASPGSSLGNESSSLGNNQASLGSASSVFGKRLSAAPSEKGVPLVVVLCVAKVAADAAEHVGMYRVSASLLKAYFRELDDLLFPYDLDFGKQTHLCDPEGNCDAPTYESIRSMCANLPIVNYCTLRLLLAHLDEIQQHSEVNKMTLTNLTLVFSPTLKISSSLLICLVKNRKIFFEVSGGKSYHNTLLPPPPA
ncbi:Rho GTPase-activating protein 23 [Podochytrium sp. JEL0797]|nr:Rho GTPase-activating protein 23 [Podochytrium sp. JEL0797]